MNAVFLASCIAGGNFLVAAVLHLCCCRLFPRLDPLTILVRLLTAALASTLATTHVLGETLAAAVRSEPVISAVTFAAVALCIPFVAGLSFYSAVTHSVRLRIATLVAQAPGARQAIDEIMSRYDADEATRNRIQQMVDGGYLEKDGSVLRLTRKGDFVSAVSGGGKRLFNAGLGG